MSSIFDYEPRDGEDDISTEEATEPKFVSVSDSGSNGYSCFRISIPKEIAESKKITEGDQLAIRETEEGIYAEKVEYQP